jgi:hypothetical protein
LKAVNREEIDLCPDNIIRGDRFSLSTQKRPLIYSLKEMI